MPKVTVYMPNYNYGKYISEAIDSVLKQSFIDWELIIIDDGSTDNSINIINKYRENPKVRIIQQKNKGLNVTNNIAIRLSNSQYIVRLDPDDYLDENFLLVLSNALDKNSKYGLVYPDYYLINENKEIINIHIHSKVNKKNSLKDSPAHGACTMFRKDILVNIGSYDEVFKCQDGYDIWLKFIQKYHPLNINLPLFYYRQHSTSITKNKKNIIETKIKITKKFNENVSKNKSSVLAIVPITNKSLYEFNKPFTKLNGKPLLFYTLSEIKKCKSIDKTIISTDDIEVKKYIKKYFKKFKIYMRKEKDESISSNHNIIKEINNIKEIKNKFDYSCMLYISTPLRKTKHIDYALSMMQIFNTDKLISVSEELSQLYRHDVDGLKKINDVSNIIRFERDSIYKENGCLYVFKNKAISKKENKLKIGHIKMLQEDSLKINSKFDLFMAEQLLKYTKNGK